jgi:hypothetical protein
LKLNFNNKQKLIAILALCLCASLGSYVIAEFVWNDQITIPTPTKRPTTTFSVSATMNGTAVSNPNNIAIPSYFSGDSFVVVYTITSTANQGINVAAVATPSTGITATWDHPTVALPLNGNTATMFILGNICRCRKISAKKFL